jgi:hypothetical protein
VSISAALRDRCWRNLATAKWPVQSSDGYRIPPDSTQAGLLERPFVERFIEGRPGESSGEFDSVEEAIAAHERAFSQ